MDTCRACTSDRMYQFLRLGDHPPANQFLSGERLEEPEPAFPLDAYACLACGLIQIPDQIPADFFRHYVYMPSASEQLHRHFAGLADVMVWEYAGSGAEGGLIVDIGSNDGLFLKACSDLGARTLGIEPASNLTEMARAKGLEIVNEYFGPATAEAARSRYGPAAVIVTTNTFNHIGDLHDFMQGVATLLAEDGVFVVEVPQALDLVAHNEFDTIYHEHLSEFSLKSLVDLYRFFGMEVFAVERIEIHGGSMRVFAHKTGGGWTVQEQVGKWLQRERDEQLLERDTYDAFRARVEANRTRLVELLKDLRGQGKRIAGYGAPAKGNTLLNYCGIGTDLVEFLADRNTLKQGLYSPGMHIPVVPPEKVLEEQPDYLLILAWNFAKEIMRQQVEYRKRGGRFILPIPSPTVVD